MRKTFLKNLKENLKIKNRLSVEYQNSMYIHMPPDQVSVGYYCRKGAGIRVTRGARFGKKNKNRQPINSGPPDFFNFPPPLFRYTKVVCTIYIFQPAYYQFGYQVDTLDTGDYHGHMEQLDGNVKRGKY